MPPLVGVAVKVTLVPAHIVVEGDAAMVTDGVTDGVTVIVMVLDVAGEPVAQPKLEVIITLTWSVFANAALE